MTANHKVNLEVKSIFINLEYYETFQLKKKIISKSIKSTVQKLVFYPDFNDTQGIKGIDMNLDGRVREKNFLF